MGLREQHLYPDTGQNHAEYDNFILAAWRDCVAVCVCFRESERYRTERQRENRKIRCERVSPHGLGEQAAEIANITSAFPWAEG